jgi:hypothetical protein
MVEEDALVKEDVDVSGAGNVVTTNRPFFCTLGVVIKMVGGCCTFSGGGPEEEDDGRVADIVYCAGGGGWIAVGCCNVRLLFDVDFGMEFVVRATYDSCCCCCCCCCSTTPSFCIV